jgi:hypothetical protein
MNVDVNVDVVDDVDDVDDVDVVDVVDVHIDVIINYLYTACTY